MKKYFTILCIAGLVAGMSCKFDLEDDPALTPTYSTFSFATATTTVTEGEQTATVTVNRGSDAYEGTVTLQVVATGSKITNPAVENTDFTLSTKTIRFDGRYTSENIVITTAAANGKATGDKQFGLRLAQGEGAVQLSADTAWVTIKDADEAVISFEITENLAIAEGDNLETVTLIRSGADWEGTVTLETLTEGLTNPAAAGADYVLSASTVAFSFGETSKTVTITPRADDNDFTGNTPFVLSIKSAPGATINEEESQINVTITEAGGFAGFKTFLANNTDGAWETNYYDYFEGDYGYSPIRFVATTVDSVYNLTLTGLPAFTVSFSKQDYSMTLEFPKYAGTTGNGGSLRYLRWSSCAVQGRDIVASEVSVKLVVPFKRVNIYGLGYIMRGYELPATFILGLWGYRIPDYVPGNVTSVYFASDDIVIDFWQN
jgi:hypothetical protein